MKTNFKMNATLLIAFFIVFTTSTNAQETATEVVSSTVFPVKEGWNFLVEPYAMFPNMSGKIGLGDQPDVSFNAGPSEIFSNLKMGAMLYLEASHGKWNINTDLLYMNVAEGIDPSLLVANGTVSAKQLGWETAGLYSVIPNLQVGVGILLNSIESEVNINRMMLGGSSTNINKTLSETWVDAMIIASFVNKPGSKFLYKLRGEVGGFGISGDSNFAWQVQGYAGYRVIGLDYATGSGSDRFLFDDDTYGGVVRFGFNL